MKRINLLSIIIVLVLCACSTSNTSKWSDGTFEGSSKGLYGDVVMSVVIENGEIKAIEVVSHEESPGITDAAFAQIPQKVIEKQTVEGIDTLAGATVTSDAIVDAITKALEKAEK